MVFPRPDAAPLRLSVIVGSTREGRVGDRIGRWFVEQARCRAGLDVAVLDLADFAFPSHYPAKATAAMMRFTTLIGEADAFVVVTPEYNRSFPASLKQAIDYAYDEWHAKPVGFVSYGCTTGGRHAVEALRPVFTELHTVTMRDCVSVDLLDGCAGGGEPGGQYPPGGLPGDQEKRASRAMLDQLLWWGRALRSARGLSPYIT